MPKKPPPAGRKPAAYRVFISHATADKWIARMICKEIGAIPGVATFRDDRDIPGGNEISETIKAELEQSDEVLLLLTPTSETRPWVIYEIGLADAFGKRIVPVWYNTTPDVIPNVSRRRGFTLNDFDNYLDDLRNRLKARAR